MIILLCYAFDKDKLFLYYLYHDYIYYSLSYLNYTYILLFIYTKEKLEVSKLEIEYNLTSFLSFRE